VWTCVGCKTVARLVSKLTDLYREELWLVKLFPFDWKLSGMKYSVNYCFNPFCASVHSFYYAFQIGGCHDIFLFFMESNRLSFCYVNITVTSRKIKYDSWYHKNIHWNFACSHVDEGDQGVNDAQWLQREPVLVTASGDGR